MKTAPADSNVIILPVIRIEREAGVALQARLGAADYAWLVSVADIYWDGDIAAAASALLADVIARERARMEGKA